MQPLNLVKIGGNVLDDAVSRTRFVQDFAALPGLKVLVHGGGKLATAVGRLLGLEPQYVDGRRVTDRETLEVVTMVYGGLVNKQLVAGLQASGCNALGITGADGGVIRATRRPAGVVDYGFVGDLHGDSVNRSAMATLLKAGLTPVLAPLTYDGTGGLLNTNADTIAQAVAVALAPAYDVQLLYCFEHAGVLRDAADATSVIPTIDAGQFQALRNAAVITGGMIPKVQNALAAVSAGVRAVVIGNAAALQDLATGGGGTRIV